MNQENLQEKGWNSYYPQEPSRPYWSNAPNFTSDVEMCLSDILLEFGNN